MSAVNTDDGVILEALNDKLDRDANNLDTSTTNFDVVVDYQVPTAANNYTWYRKYSSGWVEQGGRQDLTASGSSIINIILPIEMADTSYLVLRQMEFTSNGNSYAAYNNGIWVASGYPKTTTSFYIQQEGTTYGPTFNWEVKGMAAVA